MDVVIAAGDAAWESAAIREVEGSSTLRLARRCVDVADLLAVAQTGRAAAALVSAELPGLDVDAVHRLERAGVRVAAVGADAGRCEALGITRRLRLGALDEVARDEPVLPASPPGRTAPVIAVWGPAGAPGRSTVALGLASATAARGVDTVLVDADTHGGAQSQMLSVLDDVSGLVAACRAANQGRGHEVVDHLVEVDPGLRLLTGLPRAEMWAQVRAGALDVVLAQLRSGSQLVVVDCGFSLEPGTGPGGGGRNQTTLQVLGQADLAVAVGRPEPVGLARLVRGLHDLSEIAPGLDTVLVINLVRTTLGWGERDIRATISRLTGLEPAAYLPLDQSGLDLAAVSGQAPREASPSSPFVARVEVLAGLVLDRIASTASLAASGS
ncbi:chromosome partitioning protein [Aeromicrobium sp. SMF47]|uniref:AAA family ATPase n=1 Tax=Aeromicrobium yanjiei TaxID=2662028 RepID=UPI00129E6A9E|nr:chromosome partitioning protein [Aeromicrobium yanjiei]MRJ76678.1 chromosome partitioning protein [Aeromicrobium yanjiei]